MEEEADEMEATSEPMSVKKHILSSLPSGQKKVYESADLLIALQSYERMPTNPPTLECASMLCAKSMDPTTRRLLFNAMRQHLRGNETVRR